MALSGIANKDVIARRAAVLQSGLLQVALYALGEGAASVAKDDGAPDAGSQVDAADPALSNQLKGWATWVSDSLYPGQPLRLPQYSALATALAQAAAAAAASGSSSRAISRSTLAEAFAVDSAGADEVPPGQLSKALGALATALAADGSAAAGAAILQSLLKKLQPQTEQLRQQAAGSAAPPAALAGGSDDYSSDDELDKLLAEDTEAGDAGAGDQDDIAPASDQTPAAAPAPPAAAAAAAAVEASAAAGSLTTAGYLDYDDALSLDLSCSISMASASAAPTASGATAVARVGPPALGSAVKHDSAKSLGGNSMGALSRTLSAASSVGIDDLPDNLDAMESRGAAAARGGAGKGPRTKPLLAGLMESEQGKGAMAAMPTDLRDWSNLKSKQPGAAMVAPPNRPPPGAARGGPGAGNMRAPAGGRLLPLPDGKLGAAPQAAAAAAAQHAAPPLLSSRTDGPKANPLHNALLSSNAIRQSMDRATHHVHHLPPAQHGSHASSGSGNGCSVSRKDSNTSGGIPAIRQRSLVSHLSRKAAISEPGPVGPQAEWRQLPALGHGVRLQPHELRQPSSGNMRSTMAYGAGHGVSKSVAISAPGGAEDKLPSLPALMGARGAPPRAAELLRNASRKSGGMDSHHVSHQPALPGLNRGGLAQQPSRALRLPSRKSFKSDRDF
ncbi:hypothetical protein HYH02_008730 [Chlamydomonas schloesseri]|uniref:Uncharacterized protein n=1 Tax=Chlamydomonas schloesseri TaxID=2026947 RepID=A0A835WD88_9CHLO|nr:hypothetical protein HYH02_008730 [Chlamydomonas schloesseri]|eukprot:KAG2445262.1 hypothetical protein HYH02_008730 [Chlamydomonas schloesseri]